MSIKSLFLKYFFKKEYYKYKTDLEIKRKIKILKSGIEEKINKINYIINNSKEISFLHSGHLGDIICSLPVIKEISKTHKCNLYITANKPLPLDSRFYKYSKDLVFLDDRNVDMIIPLLEKQPYLNNVKKFDNESIDIDLDLFRKLPVNFIEDSFRWYSLLTGVHADLTKPSLFVDANNNYKNKIVIIRSKRKKNSFINYNFLKDFNDLLFLGLKDEYFDLKKEVPNLEFHDCKNFLEMAEIIQSCKFFLGNPSLGYVIAEALKVPRLLENFPEFHVINPMGLNAYDFYFQSHFEKLFKKLYNLKIN